MQPTIIQLSLSQAKADPSIAWASLIIQASLATAKVKADLKTKTSHEKALARPIPINFNYFIYMVTILMPAAGEITNN
jgi:hypothetical protein